MQFRQVGGDSPYVEIEDVTVHQSDSLTVVIANGEVVPLPTQPCWKCGGKHYVLVLMADNYARICRGCGMEPSDAGL